MKAVLLLLGLAGLLGAAFVLRLVSNRVFTWLRSDSLLRRLVGSATYDRAIGAAESSLARLALGKIGSVADHLQADAAHHGTGAIAQAARRILETLLDEGSLVGFGTGTDPTNDRYAFVITEDRDQPFQITDAMRRVTADITGGATSRTESARRIFDWVTSNIRYGDSDRGTVGYRSSQEVFQTKEGVCGEQAVLVVVMARSIGLKSNYASVTVDCHGKNVNHACAAIDLEARQVLIDPAYRLFDARHQGFQVRSDRDAVSLFKKFRGALQ